MIFRFLFLLFLVSCSSASFLKTNDFQRDLSATSASDVKIYPEKLNSKNYKILGLVASAADAGEDSNHVVELLKEQAARMGANAIMETKIRLAYGYWNTGIEASGVAIKVLK